MCKIAPKQCMTIFVELMNYFTKCDVNWNLIKIIDIFGMLFISEPKFTKKKEFIKILSEQLVKTKSKSVEAQLVKLVMTNFDYKKNPNASELIQSSEDRLKLLIFSQDNNLLVLSLRILKQIFENNKLSHSNHNYINDIFTLLNSNNKQNCNVQILRECITILQLIVSKDNFVKICQDIREIIPIIGKHAIDTIIDICCKDSYSIMETNDHLIWFIELMFDVAKEQYGKESEQKIGFIIRDLSQRISSLREMIVGKSVELFEKIVNQNKDELSNERKQKNIVTYVSIDFNEMINDGDDNIYKDNSTMYTHKNANNSLLNIILFIIGEYTNNIDISKTIDTVYTSIIANGEVKKKYYVSLILCLIKLVIKDANNNKKLDKEKYAKYIQIKYEGNDIEPIEANNYYNALINDLFINEGKIEQLKNGIFSHELKPLAANAHLTIKPPQYLDLTSCLPINDTEMQISKKSLTIKETSKVEIDKTLYTPSPNN